MENLSCTIFCKEFFFKKRGMVFLENFSPDAPVMSIFFSFLRKKGHFLISRALISRTIKKYIYLHSRIPTVSLPEVGTYRREKQMSPCLIKANRFDTKNDINIFLKKIPDTRRPPCLTARPSTR